MQSFKSALFVMAGATLFAPPAMATVDILYWVDQTIGTDAMGSALESLDAEEFTVTYATSAEDFTSQIETGNYDLGILFIQANDLRTVSTGASTAALDATMALHQFVAEGGLGMFTDWTRDADVAGSFGFSYTGNTDFEEFLPKSTLSPEPEVITLENPGWASAFSFGLDAGTSGQVDAHFTPDFGSEPPPVGGDLEQEAAIVRTFDGRFMAFGFLSDTFVDPAQGQRLYAATIAVIPEPATISLLLGIFGFVGVLGARMRQHRGRD